MTAEFNPRWMRRPGMLLLLLNFLAVTAYAQEQRYAFVGAVEVSLADDEALGTGVFRIRSEVRPGPQTQGPAAAPVAGPASRRLAAPIGWPTLADDGW